MEQDVIFLSKSWLPVVFYYLAGVIVFIGCYGLYRCVRIYSNALGHFLFIIITTLFCAIHIIIGYYDAVGYHNYGLNILRTYRIADYDTIRLGVILFVALNMLLLQRL